MADATSTAPGNRHWITLHLRTLPLCHFPGPSGSRPAWWLAAAWSAGGKLPLFLARDLGAALTLPDDLIRSDRPAGLSPADPDYAAFLDRVRDHRLVRRVREWDLSDPVVGVILARLTGEVDFPDRFAPPEGSPTAAARRLARHLAEADPAAIRRNTPAGERADLKALLPADGRSAIESALSALDPDELAFVHRYGPRMPGAPDPRDLMDLFGLLALPGPAARAVSQVLRLMPRISPSLRRGGAQTYPTGGYEGITRRGTSLDSLVPTELAYPESIRLHRLLNGEALYYGREREPSRRRDLAWIVTQAGLEISGDPWIMAQGLTLALAHGLSRRGYTVRQSFMGSRLSPPAAMDRPADVQRVLYYQDPEPVRVPELLSAIRSRLRRWSGESRRITVFWAVDESWDAEGAGESAYAPLTAAADHQAWFIRRNSPNRPAPPPASRWLPRYYLVDCAGMWEGQEGRLRAEKLPKPAKPQSDPEPPYRLRSEPGTVADEEAEEAFNLRKESFFWKPVEYIPNDFEDRGETVHDRATGLAWQKAGSDNWMSYADAQAYVEEMNRRAFGGRTGWRLPTVDELASLLTEEKNEKGRYADPLFDAKQGWCWTADRRSGGGAWYVLFNLGDVHWSYETHHLYVRLVLS